MNISPYHIQNVIRAYGQRVNRRSLVDLKTGSNKYSPDVIDISSEAKRKQITEKVATDIIARVKGQHSDPQLGSQLVEKIGVELGGTVQALPDDERGSGFLFRVVDSDKGEVLKELSSQDTEKLILKVYDKIEALKKQ